MTSAGLEAGPAGGIVAGLSISGGLDLALPCASAKRSRLFPEILFLAECPFLCPRDRKLIKAQPSEKRPRGQKLFFAFFCPAWSARSTINYT